MKSVAFLFDNDGVLVDSSEAHWHAWLLLMEEEPLLKKMDFTYFKQSFGKRNDLILSGLFSKVPLATRRKWAERKEELFRASAATTISLLPGMETFLEEVAKANIPRIIASSTPPENLEMFLRVTPLGKFFDCYVSAEQVAHGKPAPDVFLAAAARLDCPPHKAIVFEDAPAGIAAGKAAGAFVVALATTHQPEELSDYDLLYENGLALDLPEILNHFAA